MQSKPVIFQGSGTAMVTPFTQTGLNLKSLDRLIDFQIENQTDALIMCGTTGEPATMTIEEEAIVIEHTVSRVNGRIPVIAGAGSNETQFAIKSAKQAKAIGADGLLLVTPYYNKTTQTGLVKHFSMIADATDLPIILYNVPSRTGLNMLPSTVKALAAHPNIVAVKEASGDISQIAELAATCPEITIYSGNDDQVLPILSLGGKGVISVSSNIIPRIMHDMVMAWLDGNIQPAIQMQLSINELCKALFCEVNPIPVKTALNDMGFDCGPLRMPLVDMDEANHQRLLGALKAMALV